MDGEASLAVLGQRVGGDRRLASPNISEFDLQLQAEWRRGETDGLAGPYTAFVAVGVFGAQASGCSGSINGTPQTVRRRARSGYRDLGAEQGNAVAVHAGIDWANTWDVWAPSEPRTVDLSGRRMFAQAWGFPVSRALVWKEPIDGVEVPASIEDGFSFGADDATRIDVITSGIARAGPTDLAAALVWFDLD